MKEVQGCPHNCDSWCLPCVAKLQQENKELKKAYAQLAACVDKATERLTEMARRETARRFTR